MIRDHENKAEFHASWGVSFHKQGQSCGKYEADSVQMHTTIG